MSKVDRVLAMIRRLSASELVDLSRKLEADPNWPPKAGAPVGAKPDPRPPTLSARARARRPKEGEDNE